MGWTTHDFDDLVIDLGTREAPLPVAVVAGTCNIEYRETTGDDFGRAFEWDLAEISLDAGHYNGGRFRIDHTTPLYSQVAAALTAQRSDDIYREIEVNEGLAHRSRLAA